MARWLYPCIYARAKGFLSRMLSPTQVEEMLKSDVTKLPQVLLKTSYKDVASNFSEPEFSIISFEKAAREKLFNMLKTLITRRTRVPSHDMGLVNLEFKKFEALNIKEALRILHLVEIEGEEVPENVKKFFIPIFYPLEYYEQFLEQGSIAQAIKLIKDKSMKKALIKVYKDYKRTKELSILETIIDISIYKELRNLVKYWRSGYGKGKSERFQMYRLVSKEIDLVNMAIIMRCILTNIDYTHYLIPANFAFGDEFYSILDAKTITDLLNILIRTPYRQIARQIDSDDERDAVYKFEILSKRYIAKKIKNLLSVSPLSLLCVYGFIELKFYELGDILTIMVGKVNDLDPETIKSDLILLYTPPPKKTPIFTPSETFIKIPDLTEL